MNDVYGRGRKNRKGLFERMRIYRIIPSGNPMNTNFLCNFKKNSREKEVNL